MSVADLRRDACPTACWDQESARRAAFVSWRLSVVTSDRACCRRGARAPRLRGSGCNWPRTRTVLVGQDPWNEPDCLPTPPASPLRSRRRRVRHSEGALRPKSLFNGGWKECQVGVAHRRRFRFIRSDSSADRLRMTQESRGESYEWPAILHLHDGQSLGGLYVGMTNNLPRRIREHKRTEADSFTVQYNVTRLVWDRAFPPPQDAIAAEKKIKGCVREKKEARSRCRTKNGQTSAHR